MTTVRNARFFFQYIHATLVSLTLYTKGKVTEGME